MTSQIAVAALDILNKRIQGSAVAPRDIRVPYQLIARESSTNS